MEIEDLSSLHQGHKGVNAFLRERIESSFPTHLKITLVSTSFVGLTRLERQRKVYAVLGKEAFSSLHAVILVLRVPGED